MQMNEATQFERVLDYIDPEYHEVFFDEWYNGLNRYKDYPDSLLMFANAILVHWSVPLYAESIVGWDHDNDCFIWLFRKKEKV